MHRLLDSAIIHNRKAPRVGRLCTGCGGHLLTPRTAGRVSVGSRMPCLGPGREGREITYGRRDARGLTFSAVIDPQLMALPEPQPQGVGIEPHVYPIVVDGLVADPVTLHRHGRSRKLIVPSINLARQRTSASTSSNYHPSFTPILSGLSRCGQSIPSGSTALCCF